MAQIVPSLPAFLGSMGDVKWNITENLINKNSKIFLSPSPPFHLVHKIPVSKELIYSITITLRSNVVITSLLLKFSLDYKILSHIRGNELSVFKKQTIHDG